MDTSFGGAPPIDTITGSFTLTFDPTVPVYDSTAGLVVNNLSISTLLDMQGVSFTPFGLLGFGGIFSGVAGATSGLDDFYVAMFQPLSDTPIYGGSFYTRSSAHGVWSALSATITAYDGPARGAAVPEPGAWALMIMGFAAAGATLRRRRGFAA